MEFEDSVLSNTAKLGADKQLAALSNQWLIASARHNYSYNFTWLGLPIIQYPQDIVAIQEIVWQVKPDLIIETGIARGGSMSLSATLLMLCDLAEQRDSLLPHLDDSKPPRKAIGIDIDIRPHCLDALERHPLKSYIETIEGSSIDNDVINLVQERAEEYKNILVMLDSNHSHDHVLAELAAYAPLVSVNSYCIVFDTVIEDMPPGHFKDRPWDVGDNPKTAVHRFLQSNPDFEVDHSIQDRLQITVAADGYLKRRPSSAPTMGALVSEL